MKNPLRCWFFNDSKKWSNRLTSTNSEILDEKSGLPTLSFATFFTLLSFFILILCGRYYLFPTFIIPINLVISRYYGINISNESSDFRE